MSIMKSEIKMFTAMDIGNSLDDQLESLQRKMYVHQGGNLALKETAKAITDQLHAHIKKDFDEGKIAEAMTPLEILSFVNRWISKAAELCNHRGDQELTRSVIAGGGIDALTKAIDTVKRVYDVEKGKKEALEKAQEQGGIVGDRISVEDHSQRAVGEHPGPSSLAERRAEAKAAKMAASGSNGNGEKEGVKITKKKAVRKKKETVKTEELKN